MSSALQPHGVRHAVAPAIAGEAMAGGDLDDASTSSGDSADHHEDLESAAPAGSKRGFGLATAMFGKVAGGVRGVGGGMKAGMGRVMRRPRQGKKH